ncbi:aminotransferase class I/II-fold pyridoxal phosphate-dependent enzyme [Chloroflexi bacterium CFX6]|nr:aminotransferase class I/II-fold pyridoxal phosphate-dependent enzyme [Chloroflexi bacterium CFX6]
MKFSNRVSHLEAEGAYAVLARAQELERQGREILHLELGQPDFFTPEHVKEKGIQAIRENKTRYTPPAGLHRFRELIAEFAGRQRNVNITPEMVVVGPGSKVLPYAGAGRAGRGGHLSRPGLSHLFRHDRSCRRRRRANSTRGGKSIFLRSGCLRP